MSIFHGSPKVRLMFFSQIVDPHCMMFGRPKNTYEHELTKMRQKLIFMNLKMRQMSLSSSQSKTPLITLGYSLQGIIDPYDITKFLNLTDGSNKDFKVSLNVLRSMKQNRISLDYSGLLEAYKEYTVNRIPPSLTGAIIGKEYTAQELDVYLVTNGKYI